MDEQATESLIQNLDRAVSNMNKQGMQLHGQIPLLGIAFSGAIMDQVFYNPHLEPYIDYDKRGNAYYRNHLIVWRPQQKSRAVIFSR